MLSSINRGSECLESLSFSVDLSKEPNNRQWYEIIMGSGHFAVRAANADYAVSKAAVLAAELAQAKVPIYAFDGMPLSIETPDDENNWRERIHYENKPETTLIGLIENNPIQLEEETIRKPQRQGNQPSLF